jgi:hypothetical protein
MEALVDTSSVQINCLILSALIFCSKKRPSVKLLHENTRSTVDNFEEEEKEEEEKETQIARAAERWPERFVLLNPSNVN